MIEKKINIVSVVVLISFLLVVSCKQEKSQVTFTGKIINPTTHMVWIEVNDSLHATKLNENNEFTFELDIVEANSYRFDHGGHTYVFLKPGSNLHITLNTDDFDNSITYYGADIKENEYLKKRILIKERIENGRFELLNMKKAEFDSTLENTLGVWEKELLQLENIESEKYAKFREDELKILKDIYAKVNDFYNSLIKLTPGKTAIDFTVQDVYGKKYTLENFKNKAICIDVWASWCSACIKEMPYFHKLAEKYKNSNIDFIVISVDDDESTWRKLLKEKEGSELQLWAKGGTKSEFFKNYQLHDLPAYIVIDKNGNIVKPRAPRPSANLEEVIIEAISI